MRRLAAALLLTLAGCADGLSPVASSLTWTHFLAADDLRLACDEDAPDRFRLIYHDRQPPQLRLFEVQEDRERGGAEARARTLTPQDLAQATAGDDYSDWLGAFASRRLTPLEFATLARRLDRAGAFDPPPFAYGRRPSSVRMIAAGCRDGAWFHHVEEDPATAGELIGRRRYANPPKD